METTQADSSQTDQDVPFSLQMEPQFIDRPIPVTDLDIAHLRHDIWTSNQRRIIGFALSIIGFGAAFALYLAA
ncbi:MAG: hypothetical protein ACT4TC_23905 [Myxococcaceae bacterium]